MVNGVTLAFSVSSECALVGIKMRERENWRSGRPECGNWCGMLAGADWE